MSTTRTLAEEYLLLALDDAKGKPLLDSTKLHIGIGAAAITELVLDGHLELATEDVTLPDGGRTKKGRFLRTSQAPPADPLLGEILDKAVDAKPKDAISRVGGMSAWRNRAGTLKDQLLAAFAAEGVLREEQGKVLGLFTTTTWKPGDGSVEQEVRTRVLGALDAGVSPDPRTGALVALLSASGLLAKAFPDRDKKQIEAAGKAVSEGDFAAEGVKKAIEEVQTVMMAVMVPVIVAGGASS